MVENSKWIRIGGPDIRDVIMVEDIIYTLDINTGDIYRYDGIPDHWTHIGGRGFQFVGNNKALYGITPQKDAVWQFTEEPNVWTRIGPAMETLIAGGESLYGIEPKTGNILRYDGTSMAWTQVGGPGHMFVANDKRLCGITPDKKQVALFSNTPNDWQVIGGPMEQLIIADNALYGIEPSNGNILRYNGTPMSWTQIGGPGFAFAAHSNRLVGITPDREAVALYSGNPDGWTALGGINLFNDRIDKIVIGEDFLCVLSGGNVFSYEFDTAPISTWENGKQSERDLVAPSLWIWTCITADEFGAGYDGKVQLSAFPSQDHITVDAHFKRAKMYTFPASWSSPTLESISLGGEENFWGDQWHVETVDGWSIANQTRYTFEVNQKIPNSGTANFKPTRITHARSQPYVSTVYVWGWQGLGRAWGHVSMRLSDDTYISWYPIDIDSKRIPFVSDIYTAPARDPQTFEDDVQLEDKRQPDTIVSVFGLNEANIKKWWVEFKERQHYWSSLTQNCATTVSQAFFAGGARAILNGREDEEIDAVHVWAPWDILTFASFIQGHAPS